jgi:DNA-binding PadR family transcriptional regulator
MSLGDLQQLTMLAVAWLRTEVYGAAIRGRGGRARRVFALTPSGWNALHEARAAADRMWRELVRP